MRDEELVSLDVVAMRKPVDLVPDVAPGWKVFQEGASSVRAADYRGPVFRGPQIADRAAHADGVAAVVEAAQLEEKEGLLVVELQVVAPHVDLTACLLHEGVGTSGLAEQLC